MEQFVIAEHDDAACPPSGSRPAHAPTTSRSRHSPFRRSPFPVGSKDFAQPLALGLVVAGDQHEVARRGCVQLVAELGDVAAEPLDRFDAQMAGRLDRRSRQGGNVHAGEAQQLLKRAGHREQPRGSATRSR